MPDAWVTDGRSALFTDLYELTMLQAYFEEDLQDEAVFDLTFRSLPPARNYLVAAGLDDVLRYLESICFSDDALAYLDGLKTFRPAFLDYLRAFRFEGEVWAIAEGTPVFAPEPVVEVIAPLPQAQLVETFLLNQVHFQTLIATKASRVVHAARGRPVYDFGARRAHGTDAAMKAARAAWVAGVAGTSNVLAGYAYGIPLAGTMAHSYIEAHEDEREAFTSFSSLYPRTTLLVDTYDTLRGVERAIEVAKASGAEGIGAVRLDSGDLERLSRRAREMLDVAGLKSVRIFASGGLDETEIEALLAASAPIDAFGVGTDMDTSADEPRLDSAYKLAEYAGRGRMKLSAGKASLPGRKQVYRRFAGDVATGDTVALGGEVVEGEPLLQLVMSGGRRTVAGRRSLQEARDHCREQIGRLPEHLLSLEAAASPYPVAISDGLRNEAQSVRSQALRRAESDN